MIVYLDTTFCSPPAHHPTRCRQLTDEVRARADAWWRRGGGEPGGAPIATTDLCTSRINQGRGATMTAQVESVQRKLVDIGFPISVDGDYGPKTTIAVSWFQEAWTRTNLVIDGICGPVTGAALDQCHTDHGRISDHFRMAESKSKGDGWPRFHRDLVRGLEKVRALKATPIVPISVYRDPAHNKRVGGATSSQHLHGRACDISRHVGLTVPQARSLQAFSGIGYRRADGRVTHVDVRTGRSVGDPAIWRYR